MVKFISGVNDEEFREWLRTVENNFLAMTETMINVAENIKDKVQTEYVPIDTGRLSRSFKWTILTDNSRMKVLQVQMSALNPKTGFDYAYTQHLGYRNSKSWGRVYYRRNKIISTGFFNYKRDIIDSSKWEINDNYKVSNLHRGEDRYLQRSILMEESSAYELIEKDYLSLFEGVHIR